MSKGFDLEPPKAPIENVSKRGLFGNLFRSKKQSSLEPETPIAQETDIAALRDKLGIGPVSSKSSQQHFDDLETSANSTTDADVEQYEKEQSEIESIVADSSSSGSLDDALEEMSDIKDVPSSPDETFVDKSVLPDETEQVQVEEENPTKTSLEPELFIDPSLVDDHNFADEDSKQESSDFNVDNFSDEVPDLDVDTSVDTSVFAQEEIAELPDSATSDFADDTIQEDSEPSLELGVKSEQSIEEIQDTPSTVGIVEEETNLDESPFAQSEFEDMGDVAVISEDTSSKFTDEPKMSPFAEDDDKIVAELKSLQDPLKEEVAADIVVEPVVEKSVESVVEEEGMNPLLDTAVEQASKMTEEEIVVPISKPKKTAKKKTTKSSKKVSKKSSKIIVKPKLKKEIIIEPKKEVLKDVMLISDAKKEQIAKSAEIATEKKFQIYLAKEEKITKDFLRRERLLSKYLDSEKQNFLSLTGQLTVTSDSNEILATKEDVGKRNIKIVNMLKLTKQLESESDIYENKVQQLYEKKYDAFSKWIEQESKLLRENLANFEKDVKTKEVKLKLKQKSILDTQKDVLAKIKVKEIEYKTITRKIALAEKKVTKKQLEFDKLISDHSNVTEKLINREVDVKAQEMALDERRSEVEKDLSDKQSIVDAQVVKQQKILDELIISFSQTKEQNKNEQTLVTKHIKEKEKLDAKIIKDNTIIKQKEKEIKLLDKDILSRQREVEKKEEKLSYLDKKQERFKQEQKKSQSLLEKRELGVLDKININEKLLRTIELKRAALIALEDKIENEGFQSYLDAKLDQINPDDGVMSDEEHILPNSPLLGSKIHHLIQDCKQAIKDGDFVNAKKLYAKIRHEYVQLEIPHEEKSLLYTKIRETYDDINLKMLEVRSEVRTRDIA